MVHAGEEVELIGGVGGALPYARHGRAAEGDLRRARRSVRASASHIVGGARQ